LVSTVCGDVQGAGETENECPFINGKFLKSEEDALELLLIITFSTTFSLQLIV
jgi:hypothetical protein